MAISMRPMANGTAFILGIITLVGMVTAGAPLSARLAAQHATAAPTCTP